MALNHQELDRLKQEFQAEADRVDSDNKLQELKVKWLGKNGVLRSLFAELRTVPEAEKPAVAASLNQLKSFAEEFVATKESALTNAGLSERLSKEFYDLSLPSSGPGVGRIHPMTYVERKVMSILRPFGFQSVSGPEIETEYYCFDALNTPAHHPARDMQDTFYTDTGHLLRTHTTSIQARWLEKRELPVRIAAFGRVYRNETEDASHQAMFHQFELVWLDKALTLSNLQALISHILKGLYGKRTKVRFVPKFYPYTEPSIGPQIDCSLCAGKGCSACGGAGWVTIGGAGMIHRNVLNEFGYDPESVSGFAFGLGTSRLASQYSGIPTLKQLYENDLRLFER